MPSKARDRDRDRDLESPKPKDKPRHKSSRSSRKAEKATTSPGRSPTSTSPTTTRARRSSMPVPELERRSSTSPLASKTSLPYPSFSKAHSKEAVGSRENVVNPRLSYYTPDPTDIDKGKTEGAGSGVNHGVRNSTGVAPPSPPETTVDQSSRIDKAKGERVRVERKKTDLQKAADDLKKKFGRGSMKSSDLGRDGYSQSPRSRNSVKDAGKDEARSTTSARNSKPSTPSKLRPKPVTVEDTASSASFRKPSSSVQSSSAKSVTTTESTDSDATSIAPNQPSLQRPFTPLDNRDSSPATDPEIPEPRTPTLSEPDFPPSRKETPAYSINGSHVASSVFQNSPMPPPPPPPPELPMPKVDYLMQNGGLPQAVPRSLLAAGQSAQPAQPPPPISTQVEKFFSPFNHVLDGYTKVMSRSGSLAVATGYRSVARRLLDRLEAVFARDISSETCDCVLCQSITEIDQELDDERGVSWGEILEYVCGRQDLPQWPPFLFDHVGLGISPSEHVTPMQKLDVDVPEEFRDHYIRQSKKTKQSVDRWLEAQPKDPTSPPQDVDDETLTFAMLTRLEPEQRPIFSSLLGVLPSRPPSTAGTPLIPPTSDFLQKTGLAIQRLYRLSTPPRDPESTMYLLTNPHIHNVLATLAAISDGEWEILTSGRFDGFLRSGAEDTILPSVSASTLSNVQSRNPTPTARINTPSFPPSRNPTPAPSSASTGGPVALDEETEIAVLAEIEREIYLGMEALEDAFEALHLKAETVRRALRERGAGLAQASQKRRGSCNLDARMGTPASHFGCESETDDGIDDGMSELAPDDSASNASRSRHRRPKRRNERRTPAPVEEEDEEDEGSEMKVKGSRAGKWR